MVPPKKRKPDEAWDALEKMAHDEEVERVLGLSDEALDSELAGAGVDAKGVRERGRALGEKLVPNLKPDGRPPPGRVVPFRRARWAALVAAALGGTTLWVMGGAGVVGHGYPGEEDAGHETAAALRAKASSACAAAKWRACLGDLDAARALDPAGEEDGAVRKWRLAAESAMRGVDGGP
jgi:hypothetical protein